MHVTTARSSSPPPPGAREGRPATATISLIIPMLNEREGLEALFSALATLAEQVRDRTELVVVDDGSSDGTRELVTNHLARFKHWRLVWLARNFGQQPAYRAGLAAATGDAAVFLDADLQDPPELVPGFIARWREGYDVVTGVRTKREERGLRRLGFEAFHFLFHRLTDGAMPRDSGMFALVDRRVINHLLTLREVNLFLPALKGWFGFRQAVVPYARRERAAGQPSQSLRKLFDYALNGITGFSDRPLQWIGFWGLMISLLSLGYAAILVFIKIAQWMGYFSTLEVKGFTTLAAAVFCLSGIQLLCLGIIGQYLGRLYRELKARPLYIVERTFSSDES